MNQEGCHSQTECPVCIYLAGKWFSPWFACFFNILLVSTYREGDAEMSKEIGPRGAHESAGRWTGHSGPPPKAAEDPWRWQHWSR